MKKTTVLVKVRGWGHGSAPGWKTDVPGLVCAQLEVDPNNKKKSWLLFHDRSGRHVRTCEKRADCNDFAKLLAVVDWDVPWCEIDQLAVYGVMSDALLGIRRTTRTDDGGTPSEGTTT